MKEKLQEYWVPILAVVGLVCAGVLYVSGKGLTANSLLMAVLAVGTLPLLYGMLRDILKGHFGVDLIAIVAIVTSFFLKEYLAGTVILLMLSGGEALEAYALSRAKRELTHLLSHAPSVAHIKVGETLKDLHAREVKMGMHLVVKPGETVPADGVVLSGNSDVDEATITGEPLPVQKESGSLVYSGTINKDGVLEIRALKNAHESQYERIVSLVKKAQESKAPVVRLADRYAVWFTALTFVLAAAAWFISHDPIRVLAVLVVATPCPLILATPIAVMSGISRAASRGIIVKNGGALELLGEAKSFVFDKTGTLTLGTPKVTGAKAFVGHTEEEIIRLAASLDQLSVHVFARSLVQYAEHNQHISLSYPEEFEELLGEGVRGILDGKPYVLGKLSFLEKQGVTVPANERELHAKDQESGVLAVYLAQGTELIGCIYFADAVRPELKKAITSMRAQGIQKMVMLTGDKRAVAEKIAGEVGIADLEAECLPETKVKRVEVLKQTLAPVVMVGDGVNDAPALAAASVGIALGSHGATAASDAGDIVIMVNTFERVAEALHIGKRVLRIAKESIFFGIGASLVLMVFAALGHIPPVFGALLQELIDVLVIFNALRVLFELRKK